MRTSSTLKTFTTTIFMIVVLSAAVAANAQIPDTSLHFHGFGDWVYGRTDGNLFLSGNHTGNYEDAALGLNLRYDANDRVAIIGQVAFEHGPEANGQDTKTSLDYAFGQYTASDRLHFRFGRTYHPFGLYGEIRDIGTARPFIERPPEVYGDLGIISSSLEGIDVYGDVLQSTRWAVHYDVYGGATELPVAEPGELDEHSEAIKSVIGTKIALGTPIDGLQISLSAFRGVRKDMDESHRSDALSFEYRNERWLVRAEVAEHRETSENVRSAYIEGAFRPAGPWQVTGRLGTIHQKGDAAVDRTFLHHRDTALGLNYWFDPKVVLKTELHTVNGNRLALHDIEDTKPLRRNTRALQAGVQFSF